MKDITNLQSLIIHYPQNTNFKAGYLKKLCKGLYIKQADYASLSVREQHILHILAFNFFLPKVIVSHISAAVLHNLDTIYLEKVVHFRTITKRNARRDSFRFHYYKDHCQVFRFKGLLITSIEQTVIDCARDRSFSQSLVIADSALRVGVNIQKLYAIKNSLKTAKSQKKIQAVLENATPLSASAGETLARIALMALDLPNPILQKEFLIYGNRYFTDFYFPNLKLIAEFDGMEKYKGKYQKPEQVFIKERNRDENLEKLGLTVIHFTWKDIHEPHTMIKKFARYLGLNVSYPTVLNNYQNYGIHLP
ncbi:MAG: DUF559 domain-containing protein [Micrococcaceae bacterium]